MSKIDKLIERQNKINNQIYKMYNPIYNNLTIAQQTINSIASISEPFYKIQSQMNLYNKASMNIPQALIDQQNKFNKISQALTNQTDSFNKLSKVFIDRFENINNIYNNLLNIYKYDNTNKTVYNSDKIINSIYDISTYIQEELTDFNNKDFTDTKNNDDTLAEEQVIVNKLNPTKTIDWKFLIPLLISIFALLIQVSDKIDSINSLKENNQFQSQVINLLDSINESVNHIDTEDKN
ncbi:hypothetical protein FDB72_10420 [Clostridium botulinum]|uniref:hypothetical protein n=1 Tax=Clostridium botulinum TaxID=1491 RepID=UPI000D0D6B71|nr:hypothetical protein [Clostridium botulinum]NFM46543.1 hypothetical protein [Clostridium botulinum]PSM00370.1 hypothetical protein C6C12_11570 [Clostridium botulinum]HDK7138931.1 hypothetical protein [Clostridium botulinum]HDK7142260.1 hypothetical protein [Clostridium botulinum]HDK7144154.1 hypothetical protein [Clostridium botulinum]